MTSARTFSLLAAATVLSGWLAGAALERSAVLMQVWLTLGPESWARFGQDAASATGLTLDAAVSATLDRARDRTTPAPLVVAAVFSVLGLLFAAKAMNLVQLLAASPPRADLPPIFGAYLIWGVDFRAAAAAVAFVAVVWALLGLSVTAASQKSGAAETPAE
jgi:hypothetical protein